jgi:phage terminase Nu1 subunit (DNA packaging protein)
VRVSRSQLAAIFGVAPNSIDGWVRRGCPIARPARGRGRGNGAVFRTPDVLRWYDKHVLPSSRAARGRSSSEIRRRLDQIKLDNEEIDLAVKRGELRTVAEFTEAVSAGFARVSARMKSLPPLAAAAAVGVTTLPEGVVRMQPLVDDLLLAMIAGDGGAPDEQRHGGTSDSGPSAQSEFDLVTQA